MNDVRYYLACVTSERQWFEGYFDNLSTAESCAERFRETGATVVVIGRCV